jgi:uncharacterized protein involved in exopolysaccharide biosynthesis
MEENDVELIDYLRVMWWGKWIILACLAVALVVAGGVMWTRPDEYTGKTAYRLSESLSSLIPVQCATQASVTNASPSVQETQDLSDAFAGVSVASLGKGLAKSSSVDGDRVTVRLSGAVPASRVSDAFSRLTPLLQAQVAEIMQEHVTAASAQVTLRLDQDTQQRDLLHQQMAAITSPSDPLLAALAEKVADLELSIAQEKTALSMLQKTEPAKLFTLEPIGRPTVSRTGPHRKMSMAVAGVLGLFIGILLAFFIHYLRTAAKQECGSDREKGNE